MHTLLTYLWKMFVFFQESGSGRCWPWVPAPWPAVSGPHPPGAPSPPDWGLPCPLPHGLGAGDVTSLHQFPHAHSGRVTGTRKAHSRCSLSIHVAASPSPCPPDGFGKRIPSRFTGPVGAGFLIRIFNPHPLWMDIMDLPWAQPTHRCPSPVSASVSLPARTVCCVFYCCCLSFKPIGSFCISKIAHGAMWNVSVQTPPHAQRPDLLPQGRAPLTPLEKLPVDSHTRSV